jgi:hypothetical protein
MSSIFVLSVTRTKYKIENIYIYIYIKITTEWACALKKIARTSGPSSPTCVPRPIFFFFLKKVLPYFFFF